MWWRRWDSDGESPEVRESGSAGVPEFGGANGNLRLQILQRWPPLHCRIRGFLGPILRFRREESPWFLARALLSSAAMGAKTLEELHAYRLARALKLEVYRLVKSKPEAYRDYAFRGQVFESAASNEMNIAEGFRRYSAGDFVRFLSIARGSLEETIRRIQDGIDRGHFTPADCRTALLLADESGRVTAALQASLRALITSREDAGSRGRKRRRSARRVDQTVSPDETVSSD